MYYIGVAKFRDFLIQIIIFIKTLKLSPILNRNIFVLPKQYHKQHTPIESALLVYDLQYNITLTILVIHTTVSLYSGYLRFDPQVRLNDGHSDALIGQAEFQQVDASDVEFNQQEAVIW